MAPGSPRATLLFFWALVSHFAEKGFENRSSDFGRVRRESMVGVDGVIGGLGFKVANWALTGTFNRGKSGQKKVS